MNKLGIHLVAAVAFMLPLAANAGPGYDEAGHGKYRQDGDVNIKVEIDYNDHERDHEYEHKHKHKHKNKHKHKHRYGKGGPPPWAPAHGYRRKYHRHRYYADDHEDRREPAGTQVSYSEEFDIDKGTCDRETVGAVLGGVVGGVIGHQVGKNNDNEAVGTIAGAVVGILVGKTIGRKMDQADQQCTGQVLERAPDGQMVRWRNPNNGVQYDVTPTQTYQEDGRYCREYVTQARTGSSGQEQISNKACRNPDGSWQLANGGARL